MTWELDAVYGANVDTPTRMHGSTALTSLNTVCRMTTTTRGPTTA